MAHFTLPIAGAAARMSLVTFVTIAASAVGQVSLAEEVKQSSVGRQVRQGDGTVTKLTPSVSNRIQNRVQTRISNRIDSEYNPKADGFKIAEEEIAGKKARRK